MSIHNYIPLVLGDLLLVAITGAAVLTLVWLLWGTKKQQKRARKLLRLLLRVLFQKPFE